MSSSSHGRGSDAKTKVPVFTSSSVPQNSRKRYEEIVRKFKEKTGQYPDFVARSPGRVNLIGEHIDYCGYSVLPMAIERDVMIAAKVENFADSKSTYGVVLHNTSPTMSNALVYEFEKFGGSDGVKIDSDSHSWGNYVLCGLKGVLEYKKEATNCGFTLMVDGNVPLGSGLSSSSALVCAAAVAFMYGNKWEISQAEMAHLCARSERFVGVEGGGMDQAISLLSEEGKAKVIHFNPVRAEDVLLPKSYVFVIANTLVKAEKYTSATTCYNMRVSECRLAAGVLAKQLGVDYKKKKGFQLKDVQVGADLSLPEMSEKVKELLHEEPYDKESIASILGIKVDEVEDLFIRSTKTSKLLVGKDQNEFYLYQRALHVYEEAYRVVEFAEVANSQDTDATKAKRLGKLMNESHVSCRDLYEASCDELEALTQICRESGALGSRLTGAGWGGCSVSLVKEDNVEEFIEDVKTKYYVSYKQLSYEENYSDMLFASDPANGSFVIEILSQDAELLNE